MRTLTTALALAFALGGLAPITAAQAGEGCDYGSSMTKKNDLETPAPAQTTVKPTEG